MKKRYKFNGKTGEYEYCDGKECELNGMLKDGDPAHHKCVDCIEGYEGIRPDMNELHSTPRIRQMRDK